MPTPSTFYYDSTAFCDATDIWTDSNLSAPSADGWYQVGGVYRQKLSGVLGPCQACPSCLVPCDISIGYGFHPGTSGFFYAGFNVGTNIGAVVVKFTPLGNPLRCIWAHNGVSASEYSSRDHGYRQGLIGNITGAGGIGITNLLGSNGATYPGFNYTYDTSLGTFVADWTNPITVGPYTNQASGGVDLTATGYYNTNPAFMVIPKTDPSSFLVECNIDNPSTFSGTWSVIAYCPKSLNPFPYQPVSGSACSPLNKTMYTCSVEPGGDGTNTMLGINDWAFENYTGATPVPAGVYPVEDGDGVTKCVTVDANGTITNISAACAGTC